MNITLANFQLRAIAELMDGMNSDKREIILKSCTGSGKTIILTHFMDTYFKSFHKKVFVWLTPGKGGLEEQSKAKMDRYIHGASTKLLSDVMTSGFEENDSCFINWEKLTKKGNNALKDGERANFLDHIDKALDGGLSFIIIVDESHQNDTIKADDIIEYFKTKKMIRCSATPKNYKNAFMVNIPEEDVIAEGLIKKVLIINEDFEHDISVDDQVTYLIDKAIAKQQEIHSEFLRRKIEINPLIIVQLPNNSDALLERVESYFDSNGITYENNQLAVWLADKKQNLEEIEEPNAAPIAVIIKQAVATGWDCPRAQILVKLRDNMSETFEIQTIGRIRRMPEVKHYENDLLDSCYLYTLDEKFTEGVRLGLGKGALDAIKLFLKPEHRKFAIISEYKTDVPFPRDAKLALKVIYKYFEKTYHIDDKIAENKKRLEAHHYYFKGEIVDSTKSGSVSTLVKESFDNLYEINVHETLNTHKHGKEYHHCAAEIGLKISLDYSTINTLLRRLYLKDLKSPEKILELEVRNLYSFVINNKQRLKDDIAAAMASEMEQLGWPVKNITEKPVPFPQQFLFTYDGSAKSQIEMAKNVYKGYLSSAEVRSTSEKLFEKYCEKSDAIEWFYKNGDKGIEYFSIVYEDNFGKQKSFYPDYIVGTKEEVWVVETKGGFTKSGQSEDIDQYTPKKFAVLKKYLAKYNLNGGIIRQDKQSQELCICIDDYNDDIKSKSWRLLSQVL
ncbi:MULTISPECIES: DEAD/DEAH box helicase [Dehalobacter]|jgi:type III restriction enzyme|nr:MULTISPECIES: DEAD/DEAH box helicase family protein [Dehalobacter]MCG1024991.1 DEAD/DEAH box helicase family protein [Dehalobacter sp.]QGZ99531.1 restriction endonuclease subunit R [Dehalobacter restrictus]